MRATTMLLLMVSACGATGGGPDCPDPIGIRVLNDAERWRYERAEECTGIDAPEPVIIDAPNEPCDDGRSCCVASETSARGLYFGGCFGGVIVLPEDRQGCPDDMAHESIHHLLRYERGDSDGGHKRAEWGCA